jgi:hypothetical protein
MFERLASCFAFRCSAKPVLSKVEGLNKTAPRLDELLTYSIGHSDFKDAISIEKRYFTSDFSNLS